MVKKCNVFLVGPMGAGKSTIGRQLAQRLNMEFYDSDLEIEKRTGADINWIFDVEGEKGFRKREEKMIKELSKKNNIILATGGGAILSRETRYNLSIRGIVIYLKTAIEKQLIRTQYDKKRPIFQANKISKQLLEKLANKRNPLYKDIADITICTDNQGIKVVTNQIIYILENR